MNGVDTFYANATRDLADRHGLCEATAANVNHQAFKNLDTFLFLALGVGFLDLLMDANLHPRGHGLRLEGFEFVLFCHIDNGRRLSDFYSGVKGRGDLRFQVSGFKYQVCGRKAVLGQKMRLGDLGEVEDNFSDLFECFVDLAVFILDDHVGQLAIQFLFIDLIGSAFEVVGVGSAVFESVDEAGFGRV
jgi:hypothetical protein